MDVGKGVPNHYKLRSLHFSLPYLFDIFYLLLVSLIELKLPFDLQKFLENPIHSHLEAIYCFKDDALIDSF